MAVNRLTSIKNSVTPNKKLLNISTSSYQNPLFFNSKAYNRCSKIIDQKTNSEGCNGWNAYANYYLMDNGRQIWAAGQHSAILSGAWERDAYTTRPQPCQIVEPLEPSDFIIDFAQGHRYCVFITNNGYVYSGGMASQGNLGLNNTDTYPHFKRVSNYGSVIFGPGGGEKPIRVYTNSGKDMTAQRTTYILTDKGNLYGCGYNGTYNLGITANTTNSNVFVRAASSLTNIKSFYPGVYSCAAITIDGSLYTWGQNSQGELGVGDTTARQTATLSATNVVYFIHSYNQYDYRYAFHIKSNGTVWFTGYNENSGNGTFSGLGDSTQRTSWTQVTTNLSGKNVVDIQFSSYTPTTTRYNTSYFLIDDGTVYATGYNGYGQLGDGTTTSRNTPTLLIQPSGFPKVDKIITYGSYSVGGILGINKESQRMWGVGSLGYGVMGYGGVGGISSTWQNQSSTSWRSCYPAREIHMPPPVQDKYAKFFDYAVLSTEANQNNALIFLLDDGTVWARGYDRYRMTGTGTSFIQRSVVSGYSGNSHTYGEYFNQQWRQVKF